MFFINECIHKGLFAGSPRIIMDNVRFHHCLEFVEKSGAILMCLSTYSPGLNPIEKVFGAINTNLNLIRPIATSNEYFLKILF